MIQQILQNPWVGFIGTFVGIVGVALSIIFFVRSRRTQRPAYAKQSIRWFDVSDAPHSDVKMYFREQPIQRFTITHLAFWNAGNLTIRKGDFAAASPLRLHIPQEITVFDIRVTARTSPVNGVIVRPPTTLPARAESDFVIDFDFFDADDGFVVQLVHDGNTTKDIAFAGKLPGVPSMVKVASGRSFTARSMLRRGVRAPFSHTPWYIKYFFMPIACLGLGSIGLLSMYYMIWRGFHWYQPFGLIFLVYLVGPFVLFDREPPLALTDAIQNSKETNAQV
jgi:hypothetical protein